ncbi:MAG: adenylate kinase family protein [Thermoproteota archaeon]
MGCWVISITGTPRVGKTSVARLLTSKLDALFVNLTDLALREDLVLGKDEKRDSVVVDEDRMREKLREIIESRDQSDVVVDGHYAFSVVPKDLVTHVFVLRRNPVELRKFMEESGFSGDKLWENLACEILDICLCDVLDFYEADEVCELNVTGREVEEIVSHILDILEDRRECGVGEVDWLTELEDEGILQEYLRV